jgi:hypothetical protein
MTLMRLGSARGMCKKRSHAAGSSSISFRMVASNGLLINNSSWDYNLGRCRALSGSKPEADHPRPPARGESSRHKLMDLHVESQNIKLPL